MKNILFFFAVVLMVFVVQIKPVFAISNAAQQDISGQLGAAAGDKGASLGAPTDPRIITGNIIRAILGLIGMIFTGLTVYAGFLWMTAGGNEEQVTKSKTLLTQAVFGLIVILLSYGITSLAMRIALGQGLVGNNWWINPSNGPQQ